MTRHIYRSAYCEKELSSILHQLDNLRKHDYNHFTLEALCEMELASARLEEAIKITQCLPHHVEEIR